MLLENAGPNGRLFGTPLTPVNTAPKALSWTVCCLISESIILGTDMIKYSHNTFRWLVHGDLVLINPKLRGVVFQSALFRNSFHYQIMFWKARLIIPWNNCSVRKNDSVFIQYTVSRGIAQDFTHSLYISVFFPSASWLLSMPTEIVDPLSLNGHQTEVAPYFRSAAIGLLPVVDTGLILCIRPFIPYSTVALPLKI